MPVEVESDMRDADIVPSRKRTTTECLQPLLRSMRLFGLYFSRPESDKKSCKWNGWMIHAVFVVALLWINFVRMLSVFTSDDEFGLILLNKMIFVIWSFQCAVSQTAFYAASHLGRLQQVLLKIKLSDECAKYLRRIANIYTAVAWSLISIFSAFFVYGIFFAGGFMDLMAAPLQIHVTISNLLIPRIFLYVLTFYLLSAHIFPQLMTFLLAKLITFQFKFVEKELARCLDSQDGLVGDSEIETIRLQHQKIAMCVSHIDDCLMFSNASAFCCQLSCFIINLYMLVFYNAAISDPVVISAYAFWTILMSVGLTFTAAGGIMINHYVSKLSVFTFSLFCSVQLYYGRVIMYFRVLLCIFQGLCW